MAGRRGDRFLPPRVVVGALAFVALTSSTAAAAETERLLALEWSAPPECPDRDTVVARVQERLGKPRSSAKHIVSAHARVTKAEAKPRYRLELSIVGDATTTRTLSGEDCSHLVDAAALILALDIETGAQAYTGRVDADDALDESSPAAIPAPDEPRRDDREERRPEAHRPKQVAEHRDPTIHLTGGARLTLDAGSLPRTAVGVGPAFALARDHLMLDLQGIVFGERFTVAGPRSGRGGAYVDLSVVAAHGCWRSAAFDVEVRGCVGGELGLESTTGVSVARPTTATGWRSAASGMVSARLLPRRFISPTAGFSIAFPIDAPPVYIEGFGTIFEPPSVVLRGFLGLDVNFL